MQYLASDGTAGQARTGPCVGFARLSVSRVLKAVVRLLRRVECGALEGDREPLVGAFALQLEVGGAGGCGVPEPGLAGEGRGELARVETGLGRQRGGRAGASSGGRRRR